MREKIIIDCFAGGEDWQQRGPDHGAKAGGSKLWVSEDRRAATDLADKEFHRREKWADVYGVKEER